jgi:hypothetical protein
MKNTSQFLPLNRKLFKIAIVNLFIHSELKNRILKL